MTAISRFVLLFAVALSPASAQAQLSAGGRFGKAGGVIIELGGRGGSDLRVPSAQDLAQGPPGWRETRPHGRVEVFTSGEYSFESDARVALREREAGFEAAGFVVVGAGVYRAAAFPWNYYFVVEYVRDGGRRRPGVRTFERGEWSFESDARAALERAKRGFEAAGIDVIGGSVFKRAEFPWNHYFRLEYAPPGGRPVRLESFQGGDYAFESDANQALLETVRGFERAGYRVVYSAVQKRAAFPYQHYFELEYVRSEPRGWDR